MTTLDRLPLDSIRLMSVDKWFLQTPPRSSTLLAANADTNTHCGILILRQETKALERHVANLGDLNPLLLFVEEVQKIRASSPP